MLTLAEQETSILLEPLNDIARIYSSNPVHVRKLDKLCKENPTDWKCTGVSKIGGDVIGKTYECPKDFIVFRSKRRIMTEEQRAANMARLEKMRAAKEQRAAQD